MNGQIFLQGHHKGERAWDQDHRTLIITSNTEKLADEQRNLRYFALVQDQGKFRTPFSLPSTWDM